MNRINRLKTGFLSVLTVLSMGSVYGQEQYYYYKGEKQYLSLDRTRLNILTSSGIQKLATSELSAKGFKLADGRIPEEATFGSVEFQSVPSDSEYRERVRSLKESKDVLAVYPSYLTPDNASVGSTSYFKVKLKQAADYPFLERLAKEKQVEIVSQNRYMPLWYTLKCTADTPDDMLSTANSFHESGMFASAEPDLLSTQLHSSTTYCATDPYFPQQWGLNNTRYPGIDVHACQAWEITQGEGVKVAVFDMGVDLTHPDLQANIISSYDAESGSSPSRIYRTDYHGTHCAGIISAIKDNGIQVAGIAPKSKLMSVSYPFSLGEPDSVCIADGINWAWKNGADVINNSWGAKTPSNILDEAIDSALVRGRNGKGAIVIFSTGNERGAVEYPANSNPNILSVGAIGIGGARWRNSNFGSSLDLVAPGDSILSTMLWSNSPGYLSGTSMAAAFVSGIAALVISRNPLMSGEAVRNLLKKRAQKVGMENGFYSYQTRPRDTNGTWNNEVGYGLVNAYAAVQAACSETDFWGRSITVDTAITDCIINTSRISVKPNTKLTFNYNDGVNIVGLFEVDRGATFEIK